MRIFIIPCPQAPNHSIWMQSCHALIYDTVLQYTNDVLWCILVYREGGTKSMQGNEPTCSFYPLFNHETRATFASNFIQLNAISIWLIKLQKGCISSSALFREIMYKNDYTVYYTSWQTSSCSSCKQKCVSLHLNQNINKKKKGKTIFFLFLFWKPKIGETQHSPPCLHSLHSGFYFSFKTLPTNNLTWMPKMKPYTDVFFLALLDQLYQLTPLTGTFISFLTFSIKYFFGNTV